MGYGQYSEPYPGSCLVDTETPSRWENLHGDQALAMTEAATVLRTGLKEMGANHGTEDELYLKQWRQRGSDH